MFKKISILIVAAALLVSGFSAHADPRLKITAGTVQLDGLKKETTTLTFTFDETAFGFDINDIIIKPITGGEFVGGLTNTSGVYTATFRKLTPWPTTIQVDNNTFTNGSGITGFGASIGINASPPIYRNSGALFSSAKVLALGADGLPVRCPLPGEIVVDTTTGLPSAPIIERYYQTKPQTQGNGYSFYEIPQGCLVRLTASQKFAPNPLAKTWDIASPHGAHHHSGNMPKITVEEMQIETGTSKFLVKPDNHDCSRQVGGTPISGHCDATGAERFGFFPAKYGRDDPIVYPGQKGASHHHTFFGNASGNHNSNTATLLKDCLAKGGKANCTLYWQPSMVDTTTKRVVKPLEMLVYYKALPAGNSIGNTEKFPQGLKMVIGGPTNTTATDEHVGYRCFNRGTGAATGGVAGGIPSCKWPQYTTLEMTITFPQCIADNGSGGMVLDSPDHKSHTAYSSNPSIPFYPNSGSQMYGNNHPITGTPVGRNWCPQSHPHLIPFIEQIPVYPILPGQDTATWRLSSDNYSFSLNGGFSGHADWWGAWDNYFRDRFIDQCNNKPIDCGTGYIGLSDGIQISSITTSGTTATVTTSQPHRLSAATMTNIGGAAFTLKGRISGITGTEAEKFNFDPTAPLVLRPWSDPYTGPQTAVIGVGSQPLTVINATQLTYTLNSAPTDNNVATGLNLTNAKLQWGESLCNLGENGCVADYYNFYYNQ